MAITYLSGQRVQGRSNAGTAPIVGSVSSNTTIKFSDNGSFTPFSGTTIHYVVVGGGAGGARDGNSSQRGAGGGGAGAYRESGVAGDTTFTAVADTTYTITVGAGGAGGGGGSITTACSTVAGEDGDDSSIVGSGLTTITSNGGGFGGGHSTDAGCVGNANGNASGGGGSGSSSGASGGTYGNDGGSGVGTSLAGGGGGGSAGNGADGSTPNGGNGGIGTTPSATYFSSSAIAGGGGGNGSGTPGSGQAGGGDGNQSAIPTAATANTGSGGGASRGYQAGDGATGVILLSFADSVAYATTDDSTGTTDEKTEVTDVPVGSEFEQTDDYKTYQRSGLPVSLDDLKAYYNLDETSGDCINSASAIGSTDAISSFDLSVTGATQGVTGKIDNAISFAGDNIAQADDSNLTDTNFISQAGAEWTICFWVKFASIAGDQVVISTFDDNTANAGFWIRVISTGGINVVCGSSADSGRFSATSSTARVAGTDWNFVMVQGSDVTGYASVQVNSTFESILDNVDITNTTTPTEKLIIGNRGALDNDLDGDLDELSIWDRILTSDEIAKIYNAGSAKLLGAGSWVERGTAI